MRTVTICHSETGWRLIVEDRPKWALAWEAFYDWLMTALGSPCCDVRHGTEKRSWTGWIHDHLPGSWLRDRFSVLQYRLLNNALIDRNPAQRVLDIPITSAQASALHPKFVAEMDEMFPPKPGSVTVTYPGLSSNIGMSWTWSNQSNAAQPMLLRWSWRYRCFLLATGDDARALDAPPEPTDAGVQAVAGLPAADLTAAPPPGWDARQEPYDHRQIGYR